MDAITSEKLSNFESSHAEILVLVMAKRMLRLPFERR